LGYDRIGKARSVVEKNEGNKPEEEVSDCVDDNCFPGCFEEQWPLYLLHLHDGLLLMDPPAFDKAD
jgi:hypothetical protein